MARPDGRADALLRALADRGLEGVHHPVTAFEHSDLTDLRRALDAGAYDALALTSRTTVEALCTGGWPARSGRQDFTVAAVGPGTADAARAAGLRVDLVASGSGEALVRELPAPAPGARLALPASSAADPAHAEGLREAGWAVDRIVAYQPVPRPLPDSVIADLADGAVGAVVLTSPMIARAVLQHPLAAGVRVVAIGEPTRAAAESVGHPPDAIAADPTDTALADATVRALSSDPAGPTGPTPLTATDPPHREEH